MSDINKLKEKLKYDENFKNEFLKINDLKEAIKLAESFGFNITQSDVKNDTELSENLLEAVAGGKGRVSIDERNENMYVFADNAEAKVVKRSKYKNR